MKGNFFSETKNRFYLLRSNEFLPVGRWNGIDYFPNL